MPSARFQPLGGLYQTHILLIDWDDPLKSLQLPRKTTCTHKNNPHLPAASKTNKSLLWQTLPEGPTTTRPNSTPLLAAIQCSLHPDLCTPSTQPRSSGKSPLPTKTGFLRRDIQFSVCMCNRLTCCKILLHFAHTSSSLFSLLSAYFPGNKPIYAPFFVIVREKKKLQDIKLQIALHAQPPQNNSVTLISLTLLFCHFTVLVFFL